MASISVVILFAGAGWWYFASHAAPPAAESTETVAQAAPPPHEPDPVPEAFGTESPDEIPVVQAAAALPNQPIATSHPVEPVRTPDEAGTQSVTDPTAERVSNDARTDNAAIEAARQLYYDGQVLEARRQLNALHERSLSEGDDRAVRTLLKRIADETIFGTRNIPDDPLVDHYTVQGGDVLINIGKSHDVPAEVVQAINGISDPRALRPGQRLKIPRGPFHAKIYKSQFRLDVLLGDVYIRSYRVGLGSESGTPEGVWKVKERLPNPTYFPPASASNKRIIQPDDPTNPLGERWIGLEGIKGDAVGRDGYGIHGTIEPESIGKAVSMGCVRMLNEDVAFLYDLMLPGRSTVTIVP